MTTGALLFAFDNEAIDYVAMAQWSAHNIRRHLGIPVCLVTDRSDPVQGFDQVKVIDATETTGQRYFEDIDRSVTWKNHDRVSAYDITPWDHTLLLDADYVVASDQLSVFLQTDQPFLCHRWAHDLTGSNDFKSLNHWGRHSMPMWWATVVSFRRSPVAQHVFDLMRMVRDNWQHYKDLYGLRRTNYRNDYALSIAINVISGHTLQMPCIPFSLATVMPDHKLTQQQADTYRVDFSDAQGKPRYIQLQDQDFHAMCKGHLGDIVANPC